jgi:hypothetical protein
MVYRKKRNNSIYRIEICTSEKGYDRQEEIDINDIVDELQQFAEVYLKDQEDKFNFRLARVLKEEYEGVEI